jgi:hypothetical protein
MNCPVSIKPTISGLKEKYPEFNYSWTTVKKDSIIREGLDQLPENETRLWGIKNICKKHWTFESDCEYDVVVKDLSRRFGETKVKYVSEFSNKLPAMFSKVIHQPSVEQFTTKNTKKTVEKSFKVTFETYNAIINLSEEDMDKVFHYAIQLNKFSS